MCGWSGTAGPVDTYGYRGWCGECSEWAAAYTCTCGQGTRLHTHTQTRTPLPPFAFLFCSLRLCEPDTGECPVCMLCKAD